MLEWLQWAIGLGIIGNYAQMFLYYKWSVKRVDNLRKEMLLIRTNDLHHLNLELGQIKDQVFQLAKDKANAR